MKNIYSELNPGIKYDSVPKITSKTQTLSFSFDHIKIKENGKKMKLILGKFAEIMEKTCEKQNKYNIGPIDHILKLSIKSLINTRDIENLMSYDMNITPYYVKLNSSHKTNTLIVSIANIEKKIIEANPDGKYYTGLINLNIISKYPIYDSANGNQIKISECDVSMVDIDLGLVSIMSVDLYEHNKLNNKLKNDQTFVPLTIQFFIFRPDNISNKMTAGNFIIGIYLITYMDGTTSVYWVIRNINSNKVLLELGNPNVNFRFELQKDEESNQYWILQNDKPELTVNLQFIENLLESEINIE